jgi:hypothetical protein
MFHVSTRPKARKPRLRNPPRRGHIPGAHNEYQATLYHDTQFEDTVVLGNHWEYSPELGAAAERGHLSFFRQRPDCDSRRYKHIYVTCSFFLPHLLYLPIEERRRRVPSWDTNVTSITNSPTRRPRARSPSIRRDTNKSLTPTPELFHPLTWLLRSKSAVLRIPREEEQGQKASL